jgi:hypothetical protein
MDNIGYGHQIVTTIVFFPADNEKYSLRDHHLPYQWHEGNVRVKIWVKGLKKGDRQ